MLATWNARPIPWRTMSGGVCPAISTPSSRIWPESGFSAPVIRLKKVLFPAPLGPMTAVSEPSAKLNVLSSAALTPPNDLQSAGAAGIGAPRGAGQPAAIGRHIGAGHRGSGIGREKRHHARDFDGVDETP